jgi:hypothetical protein
MVKLQLRRVQREDSKPEENIQRDASGAKPELGRTVIMLYTVGRNCCVTSTFRSKVAWLSVVPTYLAVGTSSIPIGTGSSYKSDNRHWIVALNFGQILIGHKSFDEA